MEERTQLHTGDLLLYCGRGFISWAIRSVTRSKYTHVSIVYMDGRVPWVYEVREGKGWLSRGIKESVGETEVDVYRVILDIYDPDVAIATMRELKRRIGERSQVFSGYSYRMILRRWLQSMPPFRWFYRLPNGDSDPLESDFVCSTSVAYAVRMAGVDFVHNLPDRLVTPGDIARSAVTTNLGRLDLSGPFPYAAKEQ